MGDQFSEQEDEELLSEEVYEAFQEEALELLDSWTSICLAMESSYEKSQCDSLFRVLHTLKGSSYCVGLKEFGNLVHTVEELIYFLREGKVNVDKQFVSLLLECQQLLFDWTKEVIANPGYKPVIEGLAKRLQSYLQGLTKTANHDVRSTQTSELAVQTNPASESDTTVLIVDDEEAMLELVAATIGSFAGVLTASNGEAALEIFAKSGGVDLVITDIFMEKIDGVDLVKKIRETSDTPIIVMSGLMKERFQELENYKNVYALNKPLETGKLLLFSQRAIKTYRGQCP